MKSTLLKGREDLAWLFTTHLSHIKDISVIAELRYSYFEGGAEVLGNEDAPTEVRLYKKDHYRCRPLIFKADSEGKLQLVPVSALDAGTLRRRTKEEIAKGML